eukprot:m.48422 g.48422  ORF g.48422 m.48422 type:complete len:433 (+) comp15852_c0_seq1:63-1361(+)
MAEAISVHVKKGTSRKYAEAVLRRKLLSSLATEAIMYDWDSSDYSVLAVLPFVSMCAYSALCEPVTNAGLKAFRTYDTAVEQQQQHGGEAPERPSETLLVKTAVEADLEILKTRMTAAGLSPHKIIRDVTDLRYAQTQVVAIRHGLGVHLKVPIPGDPDGWVLDRDGWRFTYVDDYQVHDALAVCVRAAKATSSITLNCRFDDTIVYTSVGGHKYELEPRDQIVVKSPTLAVSRYVRNGTDTPNEVKKMWKNRVEIIKEQKWFNRWKGRLNKIKKGARPRAGLDGPDLKRFHRYKLAIGLIKTAEAAFDEDARPAPAESKIIGWTRTLVCQTIAMIAYHQAKNVVRPNLAAQPLVLTALQTGFEQLLSGRRHDFAHLAVILKEVTFDWHDLTVTATQGQPHASRLTPADIIAMRGVMLLRLTHCETHLATLQ